MPRNYAWTREEVEAAVAAFLRTHPGHTLTSTDFRVDNGLPGYVTVRNLFGSTLALTGLVQGGRPQSKEHDEIPGTGSRQICRECGLPFQRGVTWLVCVPCWHRREKE